MIDFIKFCIIQIFFSYSGNEKNFTKYPILGRDTEMKIFRKMMSNMLETRKIRKVRRKARSVYNTLFIK